MQDEDKSWFVCPRLQNIHSKDKTNPFPSFSALDILFVNSPRLNMSYYIGLTVTEFWLLAADALIISHDGFEVFMLQFIINIAPDIGKNRKLKWVFSGWSILLWRCWWSWSNHIWIILYYSRSESNTRPSSKNLIRKYSYYYGCLLLTVERLEWTWVVLSLVRGRPSRYSLPGALTDSPVPADLIISKQNFLSLYALANCCADRAVFDCWEILDKIHIWSRVLDFRNFVLNCFFHYRKKKFHRKMFGYANMGRLTTLHRPVNDKPALENKTFQ